MPLYAALPALLEAAVERGWTRAYSRVGDAGLGAYCAHLALYMTSVEFFVYWMHRGLHDVRLGYRRARCRTRTHPPSAPPRRAALLLASRRDDGGGPPSSSTLIAKCGTDADVGAVWEKGMRLCSQARSCAADSSTG